MLLPLLFGSSHLPLTTAAVIFLFSLAFLASSCSDLLRLSPLNSRGYWTRGFNNSVVSLTAVEKRSTAELENVSQGIISLNDLLVGLNDLG